MGNIQEWGQVGPEAAPGCTWEEKEEEEAMNSLNPPGHIQALPFQLHSLSHTQKSML